MIILHDYRDDLMRTSYDFLIMLHDCCDDLLLAMIILKDHFFFFFTTDGIQMFIINMTNILIPRDINNIKQSIK